MKFTVNDIKNNSLVLFRKHNGKGRPVTYRAIFVDTVLRRNNCVTIFYDYFSGSHCQTLVLDGKEYDGDGSWDIVDIKYFDYTEEGEFVLYE